MPKKLTVVAPPRPEPRPVAAEPAAPAARPIYELSTTQIDMAPTSTALAPEAEALSERLRELAISFIGARRRVGEALLDACRCLRDARDAAEEGQWYVFLRVTGTSPDTAEMLLNIHDRAAQHPTFAEKIRSGWLSQTVAGELAKPSTPPEVLQQLLERAEPLRVADVKRARRLPPPDREILHIVDNPNYSGSPGAVIAPAGAADLPPTHAAPRETARITALLGTIATQLEALANEAHGLPADEDTLRLLDRIAHAALAIGRGMSPAE